MLFYIEYTASKTITGWPVGITRYYVYTSGDCAAAEATFQALNDAQKVAQTSIALPPAGNNMAWQLYVCDGVVDTPPDPNPNPDPDDGDTDNGPYQNALSSTTEPNNRAVINLQIDQSRLDPAADIFYLLDPANPTAQPNHEWRYFTAGAFYTRAEFLARPYPKRWPILVFKYEVNLAKPDYLQREQPVQNDQMTIFCK